MTHGRDVAAVRLVGFDRRDLRSRRVGRRPRIERERQNPHRVAKRRALIEALPDLRVAERQRDERDRQADRQAPVHLLPFADRA